MDNQNLFSQTYNQILSKVVGNNNAKFQMLANPINFSWPVAPSGQESPQAYQLMSGKPKYSEVGSFDFGDASFFDCYRQVMSILTFKVSPEKQNDLQNAMDEVTKALNSKSAIMTNAKTDYNTQLQNSGTDGMAAMYGGSDFASFLNSPLVSYKSDLQNATDAYNKKSAFLYEIQADLTTDPSLKNILAAIQTPTVPVSGPAPAGWTKVPNSDGTLEWRPVFNIATTGQDWRAKLTSGSTGGFTINLDASKMDYSYDKSWAGGNAGADFGFWGFNAGGGWEKTNITQNDNSVTVEITAESSTIVPISAGSWYDGGFMQKLARNDDNSGFTFQSGWDVKGGPGSNSVFGQYGLLSTRIRGLVVAYKLGYKITMNSSTYKMYNEKFDAGGGLRIGPFTFGASGGHESTTVNTTGNSTTVQSQSTSDDPQIIGVLLSFPGLDEA